MKTVVADLKERGIDVTSEVRTGSVHQVIEQVLSAVKPDLVVMGSEARSSIERFFMGSVAEWLARKSPVPVLVISGKYRPAKGRKSPEKRAA
jgi:nucleotide-binding universal stress UspA family protein